MGLYPPIGGAILRRFMSAIPPGSDPQPAAQPVFDYERPHGASEFAVIWCRILAIFMLGWGFYFAASTVGNLIFILFSSGQMRLGEVGIYATVSLLPNVVWFLMAWYCWTRAPKLAGRIVGDIAAQQAPRRGMAPDELLGVLLIAIGAYLLAEGLPLIARIVFDIIRENAGNPAVKSLDAYVHEQEVFTAAIRCILGLWFILGMRGVVSLLRRLSIGRTAPESGDIDDPTPRP